MYKTKRSIRFSEQETERLVQLVLPFVPRHAGARLMDVRCFDGSTTRLLATLCKEAIVHGSDTHSDLFNETRPLVEAEHNAHVFCRDIRQVRRSLTDESGVPTTELLYDAVIFFRSAGSYRTVLKYALTSLARAVFNAADVLKPGGKIILVRSHACQHKMKSMLRAKHYRALFSEFLGFKIIELNRDIVVVERP